ncbi:DUF4259 domain-containing protein [Actinoallomurus sp. CA-142502]|uniref:DUF4259 domain-containing protein n=1 Tax=Actinoallomurus sp. CA-142502 TaxID=3239885 RepID=UPI003D8B0816
MGAWGCGPFDNDTAGDFLAELERTGDTPAHLRKILSQVVDAPGRVDAVDGDRAAAAAALVAIRYAGLEVDPELADDLAAHVFGCPEDLAVLAGRTFDRLLDPADNEWHDLWVRSNGLDDVAAELKPYRRAVGRP